MRIFSWECNCVCVCVYLDRFANSHNARCVTLWGNSKRCWQILRTEHVTIEQTLCVLIICTNIQVHRTSEFLIYSPSRMKRRFGLWVKYGKVFVWLIYQANIDDRCRRQRLFRVNDQTSWCFNFFAHIRDSIKTMITIGIITNVTPAVGARNRKKCVRLEDNVEASNVSPSCVRTRTAIWLPSVYRVEPLLYCWWWGDRCRLCVKRIRSLSKFVGSHLTVWWLIFQRMVV